MPQQPSRLQSAALAVGSKALDRSGEAEREERGKEMLVLEAEQFYDRSWMSEFTTTSSYIENRLESIWKTNKIFKMKMQNFAAYLDTREVRSCNKF